MKRATYKCLDDLIQEGLHPSIIDDKAKGESYFNMIYGKNKN